MPSVYHGYTERSKKASRRVLHLKANKAFVVGSHSAGQTVGTRERLSFIPGRFMVVYYAPEVSEVR
jgi:hypothetical protein